MRCLPLADDCGMSRGITESIFRCMDAQSLLGTAVITSGDYAHESAVALGQRLAKNTALRAGVHLNLLEGKCVAPPHQLSLLVDNNGQFTHSLLSLWKALAFSSRAKRHALLEQIALEWHAQVEAVLSALRLGMQGGAPNFHAHHANSSPNHANLSPNHAPMPEPTLYIDGHLHVHALPALLPVLESLLSKYSVAHVRVPAEARYTPPSPLSLCVTGTMRRELLSFWSGPLRAMLHRCGVTAPDFFIGAFCSGCMTLSRLKAGLAHVQSLPHSDQALVEIMFHPGGFSSQEHALFCPTQPQSKNQSKTTEAVVEAGDVCIPSYASFYASPCRTTEANVLLSPEFHTLMRQHDSAWPHDGIA